MREVVEAFDAFLVGRGLSFDGTIIGGAALIIMGTINRATRDVDCLAPPIPEEIKEAAADFAKATPALGLARDWFNNGPESLARDLPAGWEERCVPLYQGKALALKTLGRMDTLRAKIFSFVDRVQDLADCVALRPKREELHEIVPWLKDRDGNEDWPAYVEKQINALLKEMGDEPLF
jgi:hypothetical protein